MISLTRPSVICCVCANFHHPEDCPTAWRYIAECRTVLGVICCICTGFHHPEDCPTAWRYIAECRQQRAQASTERKREWRADRAKLG